MKNITIPALLFVGMSASAFGADAKLTKSTPESIAKGKASFVVNCTACHGNNGAGDGPAAAALNPKPRNLATDKFKGGDTPEKIFKTVEKGLAGTAMPGFGHLPAEERTALTHYILSLRKK